MSNYGYPDGTQQNGQFSQYNTYQQYPQQAYPQLNLPGQFRPLGPGSENPLSYTPLHDVAPQQPIVEGMAVPAYQDYSAVYAPPDASYTSTQQHYLPQHMPTPTHLPYSQDSSYLTQPRPMVPMPLLPSRPVVPAKRSLSNAGLAPAPVPMPVPKPVPKVTTTASPAIKKAKPAQKRNFSKKPEEWAGENGSEEDDYTMDGVKTKSGRKVHKPSQFTPASKTPARKRGAPAKKAAMDSLFCKVCDRGHSPKSNVIVFCDGCNTPYHQLCHVPVVDNLLITLPDAEWFCATCDERRGQRKLETGDTGANLSEEQKKSYLAGLPTSHLVQLVLRATAVHPELCLFSPNAADTLRRVHEKHEEAILEERAKMVPVVYVPIPEDNVVQVKSNNQMEDQILSAVKSLDRPAQNRDIMEYIEATYVIDPQSFRVQCAEQISRLITDGKLLKEGTTVVLNKEFQNQSIGTTSAADGRGSNGVKARVTNGSTATAKAALHDVREGNFLEERYPRVEGIKLPPEDPVKDGFAMDETESPSFIHVVRQASPPALSIPDKTNA